MRALRVLLVFDAAALFLLGALFLFRPRQAAAAFQFGELPAGVDLILGMWGCALATMAIGYVVAAQDPIRHRVWVQVGIARGALECLVGLVSVWRGIVSFQQAGFGIVIGGLLAAAYAILYPRESAIPVEAGPPRS